MNKNQQVHKALEGGGVPIYGVALDMQGNVIRIDYHEDATPEQKAQAEQIVADFVPVEAKKPLTVDDLLAALESKGVITKQEVAQLK